MSGSAGNGLLMNIFSNGFWHEQWFQGPAASSLADQTDQMAMWLWWFCVAWFVLLMALMFYFVLVYRRKPRVIAQRSPSHHTWLELVWTIVPTLFLAYIFFRGFHTYMSRVVSPGNAVEMNLTGWKWSWKIEYPNGAESTAQATIGARPIPVFYVPSDQPIKLRMNSMDVMHAFWVPDLRIKQDLVPNRYTTMTIAFDQPRDGETVHTYPATQADADKTTEFAGKAYNQALAGIKYTEHHVFCAEYCGTEHSEMAALIRVVPPEVFPTYLESIGLKTKPPVEIGEIVWKGKCASCHNIEGANTGPEWRNLYGYEHEYTDGAKIVADDNHVRESIREPGKHIRKGFSNQMTPWSENLLPDYQVNGVIAYMKTLSNKGGTAPTEEKK
ncbi:MAG: cytochrome c oxidase subunit II transmembrane domain-containing protein [Phycisphaerales bacterium]